MHEKRTNSLLLSAAGSMKGENEERRIPTVTLLPSAPKQGPFEQTYLKVVGVPCSTACIYT